MQVVHIPSALITPSEDTILTADEKIVEEDDHLRHGTHVQDTDLLAPPLHENGSVIVSLAADPQAADAIQPSLTTGAHDVLSTHYH